MTIKMLRTIRLDASDTFVFETAANPDEWAVSGAFLFQGVALEALPPKARIALRSGWLGTKSLGWSTLAIVTEASEADRAAAIEALAQNFVAQLGAPDIAAAREAATEEVDFSITLCNPPVGTLIGIHRALEDGGVKEQFRTIEAREKNEGADQLHAYSRAFTIVETDEIEEEVDLMALRQQPATKGNLA
jgi:Family of unknown function (DUF6505)